MLFLRLPTNPTFFKTWGFVFLEARTGDVCCAFASANEID